MFNIKLLFLVIGTSFILLVCAGCVSSGRDQASRIEVLHGTFGTYDAEPRKPDGRVDVERLVSELTAIKANTYNFLIWHGPADWDDLQLFLPRAREKNIKVWVTLVPPSESPPRTKHYSEPFRLDYQRWAAEIAKLSLRETNLVAWSLDDFPYNLTLFTPAYTARMIGGARAINPKLLFVPCLYFGQVKPAMAETYRPFIDGVLFPYRHEMGKLNLNQWDTLKREVAIIRGRFDKARPVFVDVYATKHSRLNDPTPEYVEQVMRLAHEYADGVLIYNHQYEATSPEKYGVVKKLFNQWASGN